MYISSKFNMGTTPLVQGVRSRGPPSGVTGAPLDTNIMLWQAVIFGPDDTPWEGGTFRLCLEFLEDYPNKAPSVRFLTRMFHPNIYNNGQICLDILQNQWSPIYDISAILTSIQSLLCDPNPNSPANSEAARLYQAPPALSPRPLVRAGAASLSCGGGGRRKPGPSEGGGGECVGVCGSARPARPSQENRREYERKVKEIVEQSWATEGDGE